MAFFGGFFTTIIFGFFVYAFSIGSFFVQKEIKNPKTGEAYNIAELMSVTYALLFGMMQGLQIIPNLSATARAKVVGAKVFELLDRKSLIADDEEIRTTEE